MKKSLKRNKNQSGWNDYPDRGRVYFLRLILMVTRNIGSVLRDQLRIIHKNITLGIKLKKDEHVDHHDKNSNNDSASNLKVMKASDNIAKGNRNRKKKKK